jgi:glycosyltransferase involved in cell wall biosynthesis
MRIGVDIISLASGTVSGVEQYALQILKRMVAENPNDEFVVFAIDHYFRDFGDKLDKILNGPGKFLLEAKNVTVKKLPWPKIPLSLHFAWKVLGLPKVDKFLGGIEVMFQPAPLLLPLSAKTPRVVTFHDLAPAIYPQFWTLTSRLWHWQMNYPVRAREASKIIAVSENTKKDLIRFYGVDPEKITVVYEGVSEELLQPISESEVAAVKQKFNLPDEFLFYIGSIEPRKNVIAAVRALKCLKDKGFDKMKLVLAGSKAWKESEVWREIENLHLKNEVLFLGLVEEREKAALFRLALGFIFPSLYEGFGLPVLEAMAAGCPVITSQSSSLPEVTLDAALLIDPFDQGSINQAVLDLVSNENLRAELKAKGLKRAAYFSWDRAAYQTMEVLKSARLA